MTPLMIAASLNKNDRVLALKELGADIHADDESKATTFFHESQHGQTNVVKTLIDKSARTKISMAYVNWTPLLAAIETRNEETALPLLKFIAQSIINVRSAPIGGHSSGSSKALVRAVDEDMITLIPKLFRKRANVDARASQYATGANMMTTIFLPHRFLNFIKDTCGHELAAISLP